MSTFKDFFLCDIIGCKLFCQEGNLHIFVVYIPPDLSVTDFVLFIECFESYAIELSNIFLIGDFNSPSFSSNKNDTKSSSLRNMASLLNLTQLNSIPNSDGRLLDLVFSTSTHCTVSRDLCPLIAEDMHHPALNINLQLKKVSYINFAACNMAKLYNFKKANFLLLYQDIFNADWSYLYRITDVNQACEHFYSVLYDIIDKHVPLFKCKRFRYPNWYSAELRSMLKLKRKFFKCHKQLPSGEAYLNFSYIRRDVKRLIRRDFNNYIIKAQNSLLSDPKYFWTFIKEKRGRSSIPSSVHFDNSEYDRPQDIVNMFAHYFSSIFDLPETNQLQGNTFVSNSSNLPFHIQIFDDDVLAAISKIKNTCSAGIDQVPSFLIKDCSAAFLKPLCYLFNLSLNNSCFPNMWKIAKIVPVYKSGDISDVRSYRPISILSCFSKVYESILYRQIYFNIKELISIHQHGFSSGRSTHTNLMCMSQIISDTLDHSGQLDVIYTDLSKAFDKINHQILLCKLSAMGFSDSLIKLFYSYLSSRVNCVVYNGFKSNSYASFSGVPQGSILGPLCFIIYLNDVVDIIQNSQILIYADDIKIFHKIGNVDDCLMLQNDINKLKDWCLLNKLPLNIDKCKVVSFTLSYNPCQFDYHIGNSILQRTTNIKDLGVHYDSKFSFKEHVTNIVGKAGKMFGFIVRNCKGFNNVLPLIQLFNSLVRSRLEYCSTAWFPYYDYQIRLLENVQRKFLKYLYFKDEGVWPVRNYPHVVLLERYKLNTLQCRRVVSALIFLHKLLNNKIDCGEFLSGLKFYVPRLNNRYSVTLYSSTPRTNIGRRAPLYVISMYTNKMERNSDCDIFSCSTRELKTAICDKLNL